MKTGSRIFLNTESKRRAELRAEEEAGLNIEWPRVAPLRAVAGGEQPIEDMLTAPEAISLRDDLLLAFDLYPWLTRERHAQAYLEEDSKRALLALEYQPGSHLKVSLVSR
ncbi:hypothetical protein KQI84_03205 [bacterium]|nr:hypothetical protein [bacterium]